MIQLGRLCQQAGFDVARSLASGQLGKVHRPKLLGAGQRSHALIAAMPGRDRMKSLPRQKIHDLDEHGLAGVHGSLQGKVQNSWGTSFPISNRRRPSSLGIPCYKRLTAIRLSILPDSSDRGYVKTNAIGTTRDDRLIQSGVVANEMHRGAFLAAQTIARAMRGPVPAPG